MRLGGVYEEIKAQTYENPVVFLTPASNAEIAMASKPQWNSLPRTIVINVVWRRIRGAWEREGR